MIEKIGKRFSEKLTIYRWQLKLLSLFMLSVGVAVGTYMTFSPLLPF